MKTRIISNFHVFFIIFAILVGFTTCKDDHMIGLGSKVDLTLPVINITSNEPGGYLKGEDKVHIKIEDDFGISRVEVEYTYLVKLEDGSVVQRTERKEIFVDETGDYLFNIDTTGMEDGDFSFIVYAWDVSKPNPKLTTTEKLIYTVKNKPPAVSLQIPRPRTHSNDSINNDYPPSVVTDNYLMGVFEDLAGVKAGFPLVKFWKYRDENGIPTNYPEPGTNGTDYKANAGWESVTTPPPPPVMRVII